jgi:hypothetical protein
LLLVGCFGADAGDGSFTVGSRCGSDLDSVDLAVIGIAMAARVRHAGRFAQEQLPC